MKPVWWMAGLSALSGALVTIALGARAGSEVWLGMAAPLLVVSATWVATARTSAQHPARVTALMMTAFAGKLVFFGAYVALAIGVFHVRPVPFVVSFAVYFVALHMTEAFCLQRLFAERMRTA
jgi:hypothetical protein